eukprot:1157756-Pelagomonas_calceolata.AAC.3
MKQIATPAAACHSAQCIVLDIRVSNCDNLGNRQKRSNHHSYGKCCCAYVICTHPQEGHPESPARMRAIVDALQSDPSVSGRLDKVDSRGRTPSMEELESVHKLVYVQKLRELSSRLQQPTMVDDSTYISPGSYGSVAEVRLVGSA